MNQPVATHDPRVILNWLIDLGFTVNPARENRIVAHLEVKYEGHFSIIVDLKDKTLSLQFQERFSSCDLLYNQSFKDDEQFIELLKGNYVFDELVITRTPGATRLMDLTLDLQAAWVHYDKGDIEPLLTAIRSAVKPLLPVRKQG